MADMAERVADQTLVSSRMRAAYIEQFGSADEIRVGELPVPQAGPGDVLVRVAAVAVDPIDTYIRAGKYPVTAPFPFIIGRDLVGEVVHKGAGATRFASGQRVWCNSLGYDGRQGSFAEYVPVAQERLYPLPEHIDPLRAVAVFHPAATAFLGLVRHLSGVHLGQVVLVGGRTGNVGSAVVQLAAAMGARVVATAHGAEDAAWSRTCGAHDGFDYADPDLADAVRAVAPDGVDVVWNTSGHDDMDMEVRLLAHGGRLVLIAGLDQRPRFPVGPFYTKDARAVGFTITTAAPTEMSEAATAINALLAAGRLRMRIARVLPLTEARAAHRLVEGSGPGGQAGEKVKGRVVVVLRSTTGAQQ
jgi:NADPH:quinone reductase-like Zn-dependent oxidoreductase